MTVIFKEDFNLNSKLSIPKGKYHLFRNYKGSHLISKGNARHSVNFFGLWINEEGFICVTLERFRSEDTWYRFYYKDSNVIEVIE